MLLFIAVIASQAPARAPLAPAPDSTADAYLDPGARELVRRGRERRATTARAISAYTARVTERIYAGLRALRRDRALYTREMSGHISWHRGGADTIRMVGARERIPIAQGRAQVPEDLQSDAPDLGFDPADDHLLLGWNDSSFVLHPLAPGSEVSYRFQSGDTTRITTETGETITLYELRVIPRRAEFRLLAGSFWLEGSTWAVVRMLFRPARAYDLERDIDPADSADANGHIPGFLKPIRAELKYVTMEYALWNSKWWLPRLTALDAVGTAGSLLSMPIRYERVYSDYQVEGGADTTVHFSIEMPFAKPDKADGTVDECKRRSRDKGLGRCAPRFASRYAVVVPEDSAALLSSPELPPSLADAGASMMSEGEVRDLAAQLRLLPSPPGETEPGRLRVGLAAPGLIRYNRVEGLSLGARYDLGFGRFSASAEAREGLAAFTPSVELSLARNGDAGDWRLTGYSRIAAADPGTKPFGVGNSLGALFLGRDDGSYFRGSGLEWTDRPATTNGQVYTLRLFAERQRAVRAETNFSLPRLFDRARVFRPNIAAADADEGGLALTLRGQRGASSTGLRAGLDATMDLSVGTFTFARGSLTGNVAMPLPLHLLGAVEGAVGGTGGAAPVQSAWYLGGPATLRGYDGAAAVGPAFWRARAEVANAFPGARLALFSDAGWAGRSSDFGSGPALISAGAGASFLDGLVRVDLARALRRPTGWRLDLYLDGAL